MSNNIAEYVVVWCFNGQHDGEKWMDLSPKVCVRFVIVKNTHIHTNAHTHERSDECNTREHNALKFA